MCSVSATSCASVVNVALGRPVDPEVSLSTAAPRCRSGRGLTPVDAARATQPGAERLGAPSVAGERRVRGQDGERRAEARGQVAESPLAVVPASTGISATPAARQASQNGKTAGSVADGAA